VRACGCEQLCACGCEDDDFYLFCNLIDRYLSLLMYVLLLLLLLLLAS